MSASHEFICYLNARLIYNYKVVVVPSTSCMKILRVKI